MTTYREKTTQETVKSLQMPESLIEYLVGEGELFARRDDRGNILVNEDSINEYARKWKLEVKS